MNYRAQKDDFPLTRARPRPRPVPGPSFAVAAVVGQDRGEHPRGAPEQARRRGVTRCGNYSAALAHPANCGRADQGTARPERLHVL